MTLFAAETDRLPKPFHHASQGDRCDAETLPRPNLVEARSLRYSPFHPTYPHSLQPHSGLKLCRRIREADAILIVTPEYNYSVPGVLKNAIDWASRPYGDSAWSGKPAAIIGASVGTISTARAQYHLRQMMVFLNMFPINQPEVMIGNASERFDAVGNLTDDTTKDLIRQLLQSLVTLECGSLLPLWFVIVLQSGAKAPHSKEWFSSLRTVHHSANRAN